MRKPFVVVTLAAVVLSAGARAAGRQPDDLAGTWMVAFDTAGAQCRVQLRTAKADNGAFFLGMPAACRHAMPALAAVGRWTMPDPDHVALADPAGTNVMVLAAGTGDRFVATTGAGTYTLTPVALTGRSVGTGFAPLEPPPSAAVVELVASHHRRLEEQDGPSESSGDIAGRYAVMREKRDTGCMLTLDTAGVTGGRRAQLAPGCRDQGIVIFDPAAWQIMKGELVLTARAGHKAHLEKAGDGAWAKDPKDGGKPLGLKKL